MTESPKLSLRIIKPDLVKKWANLETLDDQYELAKLQYEGAAYGACDMDGSTPDLLIEAKLGAHSTCVELLDEVIEKAEDLLAECHWLKNFKGEKDPVLAQTLEEQIENIDGEIKVFKEMLAIHKTTVSQLTEQSLTDEVDEAAKPGDGVLRRSRQDIANMVASITKRLMTKPGFDGSES